MKKGSGFERRKIFEITVILGVILILTLPSSIVGANEKIKDVDGQTSINKDSKKLRSPVMVVSEENKGSDDQKSPAQVRDDDYRDNRNQYRIYATYDDKDGSGYYVALPSASVRNQEVQITYNGHTVEAPVEATGPWNEHDNYWDESRENGFNDIPRYIPEAYAAHEEGYNYGFDEQHFLVKVDEQGNPPSFPQPSDYYDFEEGDWVQPCINGLNVRDTPGGNVKFEVNPDEIGYVMGSHVRHTGPPNNYEYEWWEISWPNHLFDEGYSASGRYVSQDAGIDLSDEVLQSLGVQPPYESWSAWVNVEFLWIDPSGLEPWIYIMCLDERGGDFIRLELWVEDFVPDDAVLGYSTTPFTPFDMQEWWDNNVGEENIIGEDDDGTPFPWWPEFSTHYVTIPVIPNSPDEYYICIKQKPEQGDPYNYDEWMHVDVNPITNLRNGREFCNIQLGIDDLYTYNRDIIYVRSGIYREQVEIDKSITLMGENQETTIIDGERWIDYCIDITEDNVSVEGFTITRANLAGIRIRSENNQVNGHCRIYRNKIIDNNDGIDIIGNYGEPDYNTIARNILKDNHGDGISVYLSDHNTISENSIYGEYWVNICLSSSNYNTIRSNRINHSSIGIDLYSSCNNNRIYFNDITNNTNLGMRICSYGSSYHNIIYWNNFFDNYQNHNAQDDNSGINHWYLVDDSDSPIGRNGNYWEGWNGHGSYPIPGQGHREDRYPFSERDGWSHTHGGKEKCQQALGPWDPPGGN